MWGLGDRKKEPWRLGLLARRKGIPGSVCACVGRGGVGGSWKGPWRTDISNMSFAKPSSDSAREKGRLRKRLGSLGFPKCTKRLSVHFPSNSLQPHFSVQLQWLGKKLLLVKSTFI